MDGEELEGDEDWRYGPLGRAGVLKDAVAPVATSDDEPLRSKEVRPRTIWAYWAQGHEEMPVAWSLRKWLDFADRVHIFR